MDWVTLIIGLFGAGGLVSIILFFLNKKNVDSLNEVTVDQKTVEIKKVEKELESQYIKQLEQWLVDLQHIKEKHEGEITKKDEEIVGLHRQYLNSLKDMAEHKFQFAKLTQSVRKILVGLDIPYWECDKDGQLIYVNGAWLNLFGLTTQEALGTGWQSAIPVEDRKSLLLQWNAIVVDQSETTLNFNIENPITKEKFKAKAIISIVHDTAGNTVKIIGVTIKI